jgi:hypothetical protein
MLLQPLASSTKIKTVSGAGAVLMIPAQSASVPFQHRRGIDGLEPATTRYEDYAVKSNHYMKLLIT